MAPRILLWPPTNGRFRETANLPVKFAAKPVFRNRLSEIAHPYAGITADLGRHDFSEFSPIPWQRSDCGAEQARATMA